MPHSEQFERDKVCYEQNHQHMRSLNQIMWQVPIIATTLTGGLWYAVATVKGMDPTARIALLAFAGIADVGLILMINRVRDVIAYHLSKLKEFNPSAFVDANPTGHRSIFFRDRGVCSTFSMLMGIAAFFSFVGALSIWCGRWNPNP